jgi:hypothetical protein
MGLFHLDRVASNWLRTPVRSRSARRAVQPVAYQRAQSGGRRQSCLRIAGPRQGIGQIVPAAYPKLAVGAGKMVLYRPDRDL